MTSNPVARILREQPELRGRNLLEDAGRQQITHRFEALSDIEKTLITTALRTGTKVQYMVREGRGGAGYATITIYYVTGDNNEVIRAKENYNDHTEEQALETMTSNFDYAMRKLREEHAPETLEEAPHIEYDEHGQGSLPF